MAKAAETNRGRYAAAKRKFFNKMEAVLKSYHSETIQYTILTKLIHGAPQHYRALHTIIIFSSSNNSCLKNYDNVTELVILAYLLLYKRNKQTDNN